MDIQRYTMSVKDGWHQKAPIVVWDWDVNGEWVLHEDAAARLAALAEENERLRKALWKIANAHTDAGPPAENDSYEYGVSDGYRAMGEIASTALSEVQR